MESSASAAKGVPVPRARTATILVPTYNGSARIGHCLEALLPQIAGTGAEILVIDDGSTDDTAAVAASFPGVRVLSQPNAGPAAARNRGAQEAKGAILLFTDDDCVPLPNWVEAMLLPFADPAVVGVKGIYRTRQSSLTARFVQLEYEDKYRIMATQPSIDFIDTYSAGFVRNRFLEMGGYDTSFPVACAEDVELSYRMSARGWLMKFVPQAIVYHSHPDTPAKYFRKKFKFAYWRVLAVRKNPSKGVRDSHTPQLMKLQLFLLPTVCVSMILGGLTGKVLPAVALTLTGYLLTTLSFTARALRKDPAVGVLCPLFLTGRSIAQFAGLCGGILYAFANRQPALRSSKSSPAA